MNQALSCYAASELSTRGRVYKEDPSLLRTEYQRDRDRIIHSSAFRRLEYKTQVFVNHEGDMFRNRLTHSLEVSQIGRTVARALCLNEDLTEAICLAHDLGHTPFGHAGQDALNQCMNEHGGFEHNLQSLRVVDILEEKYADFCGLNLTFETREGILKHCSKTRAKNLGAIGQRFLDNTLPGLEAQVANIADEIAYNNHDVDDGLRAGLISIDELRECEIIEEHIDYVKAKWPSLEGRALVNELVRRMINSLVNDLVEHSRSCIKQARPKSVEDVRTAKGTLVSLSAEMARKHKQLKSFLKKKLYQHEDVANMSEQSRKVITALFKAYCDNPEQLSVSQRGASAFDMNENESLECKVKDYIAGMTDRFALSEFNRITSSQ